VARACRLRSPGCAEGVISAERGFDAPGERVDELSELGDRLKGAVFAPAGDVGDRFAGDVESETAEHPKRGGVHDHFGLRPGVLVVVDAESMDRLVDEHAQPRVGRQAGVDNDLLLFGRGGLA